MEEIAVRFCAGPYFKMDFDKGQHFLIDKEVIRKIIQVAKLSKKDNVIEIGAGTGNLTKHLAKSGAKITSFEIDKSFKNELEKLKKENKNLKVIIDDALKCNWKGSNKIVASVPYHLSEAILMKAIKDEVKMLVLVVGEKFASKLEEENNKINFTVNCFYTAEEIEKIKKGSFSPAPRVNSYLIVLNKKNSLGKMDRILQNLFLYKGKLKNGLMYALVKEGFTKNQSKEIINKLSEDNKVAFDETYSRAKFSLLKKIQEFIENL